MRLKIKALLFPHFVLLFLSCFSKAVNSESLVQMTERVVKSTVAVALHSPLKHTTPSLKGTGFVVHDGRYIITNYHVIDADLDPTIVEYYVSLLPNGNEFKVQKLRLLEIDVEHDLALLEVSEKMQALDLAEANLVPAGSDIAIFGYPLGGALGLYPAVHKGVVATITPDFMPVLNSSSLTSKSIKRLKTPEQIYQLDITAYPGNSGSPVVDLSSGKVIAVINKVYVRDSKESALTNPSGISYGIPIKHVHNLLQRTLANKASK